MSATLNLFASVDSDKIVFLAISIFKFSKLNLL